ncbi:hypothetical protein WICPIJ_003317 [Wickerhamomyces pijperi]|uniref:Large ribosomal subunit protein mL46 n=1 Tax=Wickerhamomyces pijperi TaxID=599730 RepID=A0A9P8Q828_WICPI|nr:hypothetical protein WICPIJ_003317 [Wickerhamomyces pijperi]
MASRGLLTFQRCLSTSPATTSATSAPAVPLSTIRSTLLLTRTPVVTPELTPFETHFYNYQSELERRLMWTFPQYFYYKKGSLSERRFVKAQKGPVSKQPGVFFKKGIPDIVHNRERREKQEVIIPKSEEDESMSDFNRAVVPNSRTTKADEDNDIKSLERALHRSLYLIVKENGSWKLPSFAVEDSSNLHRAAESGLRSLGGEQINTWTVARSPAAVLKYQNGKLVAPETQGEGLQREYVIKSRILSGLFAPEKATEFAWLNREEIEQKVSPEYFQATEFLFSKV